MTKNLHKTLKELKKENIELKRALYRRFYTIQDLIIEIEKLKVEIEMLRNISARRGIK